MKNEAGSVPISLVTEKGVVKSREKTGSVGMPEG